MGANVIRIVVVASAALKTMAFQITTQFPTVQLKPRIGAVTVSTNFHAYAENPTLAS